ncbi:MAG: hypothetical protein ABJP48_03510 [Erythrobacter sp.]
MPIDRAREANFDQLACVPVHYDRLAEPNNYGSRGQPRTFYCRSRLKSTLNQCLADLWPLWGKGTPSIILSAGTIGDNGGQHGTGYAFDLDGFYWGNERFMMDEFPSKQVFYNGINAHLYLYFSQVLSYQYDNHHNHFHVDFNFSYAFRTTSTAQTNFLQSCLIYNYGHNLGSTGKYGDGVDGIYGHDTRRATGQLMRDLGLSGRGGLGRRDVWFDFLKIVRQHSFA